MDKLVGVFAIINRLNGKMFIGSSYDLTRDRQSQFDKLRGGLHPNKHLQNAWWKYGPEVFDFITLEVCGNIWVQRRDQHWKYILRSKNGYNYTIKEGESAGGREPS